MNFLEENFEFLSFLEDEKNFVDWERSVCFLAEEKVVLGGQ